MRHARNVDQNISGQREPDGPDRAIGWLADRQHALVAGWQLVGIGIARHVIDHRIARGSLYVHHRDVYSVGHRTLTREGHFMAAVLAGGPGAVLSHRSAADLWRIHPNAHPTIEVTVPRRRRGRGNLTFHTSSLPFDEMTATDGIPVTTVPRTLFDLAAHLRPRQLERALNEAEILRLWDELTLDHLLTRYPRRAGSPGYAP